jgi:DNA-binding transcriptional MocR family regulator
VLRVGDRLPSVRQLRDEQQVSVATAVGAYLWLERQGYVRARPKSGFYVSRAPLDDGTAPAVAARMRGPVSVQVRQLTHEARTAAARAADILELGPAVVGPALLPMNRLNRSIRLALSAFADHAVRYEDPRGNDRLRRQIARLAFRQGVTCSPDDIIITSGETEAFNLSIWAVTRPGDVVAVESPGCYEILRALETYNIRAIEIPHIPHEGVHLDLLASAARKHRIKALIANATCHNALGDCASDASKAALVAFTSANEIAIIEGDMFGELLYSGERPRTLKSFDQTGSVMQCSSLAHYVAPGFNLGWIHTGRWQQEIERLKGITNIASARLPQLALAEFLESGGFEKHLRQLRTALWRSVEATRNEILESFPAGTRVSRPEGGFVLWVQLPDGNDGVDLQQQASAAGINILPGEAFSANHQYRNCVRIACGHPVDIMKAAIRRLAELLRP